MSIENRYKIIKKKYNEYLLLFLTNKNKAKITSCGIDRIILEQYKYDLKKIQKANICYILIDNTDYFHNIIVKIISIIRFITKRFLRNCL